MVTRRSLAAVSAVDGWVFVVYRGAGPVIADVGGVMPSGGVPAGGDGLAGELKRDGALDGAGLPVAGLAGAEDLFRIFYRHLNQPPVMPLKPGRSLALPRYPGR